ncbi:MAG: hypothetical protein J6N15_00195 [Ruminiclostridium sp.]|nr:hypothetical protein [Ruminiclostridium sp.]
MTDAKLNITIEMDTGACAQRMRQRMAAAQAALDAAVLKDCNYYVPLDSGALQKSAINHTVLGSGDIVWATPYARRQYYGTHLDHSRQRNPNATAKWFESAKARRLKEWVRIANDAYHKGS